ncbi:MAG TPA: pilus assembly protein TadE [Sphingomonadaceae bacterium]
MPLRWIKARKRARQLLRDVSGVAVIELAICLPPLLFMGMYGLELMNLAATNLEVSQIALSLADNASRLGQTDNSAVTPPVYETDIDSIMSGALKQGDRLDIGTRGKIVLSSLEKDKVTGKQYIHWQRCRGDLDAAPSYNDSNNNGLRGTAITGLGEGTTKVTAASDFNTAVMFVDVYYKYSRLFGDFFLHNDSIIHRQAAYLIRDDRDLAHDSKGSPEYPALVGTRNGSDTCA